MCQVKDVYNEPASPGPAFWQHVRGPCLWQQSLGDHTKNTVAKQQSPQKSLCPSVSLLLACYAVEAVVTPGLSGMSTVFPELLPPAR